MDWTAMTPGNWLTLLGMAAMLVGSYYGSQRGVDGRFAALEKSFQSEFAELKLMFTKAIEGDLRDCKSRLSRLEEDYRTHTASQHAKNNDLNVRLGEFVLRVDRLERRDGVERREHERREADRRE